MTNVVLHKADSRGFVNLGWLESRHTFSFGSYYNGSRMNFGALRVLNDDQVGAGKGFGEHPHDNMEIITIPLEGELRHQDNLGNVAVIRKGDVQVMSAGTGIVHSEYNNSKDNRVKFLQIWVFPEKRNVKPRFGQLSLEGDKPNELQLVVSPESKGNPAWIHQDAWFHLGNFKEGHKVRYDLKSKGNGIYVFVISGDIFVDDQKLGPRDGFGLREATGIDILPVSDTEFLIMEVPMQI